MTDMAVPLGSTPLPRGRASRQGRPALSAAAIVSAGRRLIERDGLDALSMRRVAAELDTAATSLYRHVADRDALLQAIVDDVAAGLPVRVAGGTPRARLLRRFVDVHDYLTGQIWVLHVLVRGEVVAENAFGFGEACLQDLRDAGLSARRASTVFHACWYFLIGELLASHPLAPTRERPQRSTVVTRTDGALRGAAGALRGPDRRGPGVEFRAVFGELLDALLP